MSQNTTKEISYSIVKTVDISVAMDSSSKALIAGRQMSNNEGQVWEQTVCVVMNNLDGTKIKLGTDKETLKDNQKVIKDLLAEHIIASVVIPEDGKNREGKSFKVCNKQGVPQWSTWDKTRRIWDYAGSIAKVLSYNLDSTLYPEKNKVAGRCDILALCKESEGHMDAIKRQASGLQLSLDKVSTEAEAIVAAGLVDALMVNELPLELEIESLINQLKAKLTFCDADQKAKFMPKMIEVAKIFN